MKKSVIAFGAAALIVLAGAITAAIALGRVPDRGQSSIPDFVMPSISDSLPDSTAEYSVTSAESESSRADTLPGSTSSAPEDSTPGTGAESSEPVVIPAETSNSTLPQSTTRTSAAGTTADSARTSAAAESTPADSATGATSTAPEPVTVLDNVLVTSGDPLHYIRFEFGKDRIDFSGVYSGAAMKEIRLFRPSDAHRSFTASGSSFSGSIDVSTLEPDYYILIARLGNNEGMYYVFQKTPDGSRAVPADKLPAARNLAFTESPMELSTDGVLHQVTVSDNAQTAAGILEEVKSLSDQICAGIASDYDKARALCEWVSANIYYDKDAAADGVTEEEVSLEFVLKYHRSVCFGWSNLYSALCQAQGITCYNASGSVVTGSRCFPQTELSDERSHSWNLVVTDGRLIWVDTVWNSSNNYNKGNYFEGNYDMQYFDIDNVLLSNDHRVARLEHRDYYGI